jgi:hypothetical protein
VLDQKHEQIHGVTFKPYWLPAPAQLVGSYIELEIAKADNWMQIRLRHSWCFDPARNSLMSAATEELQIYFSFSPWSLSVVGWHYASAIAPASAKQRK